MSYSYIRTISASNVNQAVDEFVKRLRLVSHDLTATLGEFHPDTKNYDLLVSEREAEIEKEEVYTVLNHNEEIT